MLAMVLEKPKEPLKKCTLPIPVPKEDEVLVKVSVCGVCRTDLHIFDGELKNCSFPLILGHEVVGRVESMGKAVKNFQKGDRVGIPWLHSTCQRCSYCKTGRENLCDKATFTGYTAPGGFAQYALGQKDFLVPLPSSLTDLEIAPLLCAGLIGYRAYRKAAPEESIGLYGFGASAHLIAQIAIHEGKKVFAFTREGDEETRKFARSLGVHWAGSSKDLPPEPLDAVIHFAPVGNLIPLSLKALKKGGRCVSAGIYMSDIPSFPYCDLWGEKRIESVANLTRKDASDFFEKISCVSIAPKVTEYPLEDANQALQDFKSGPLQGAVALNVSFLS